MHAMATGSLVIIMKLSSNDAVTESGKDVEDDIAMTADVDKESGTFTNASNWEEELTEKTS